jgi:hypothetical protein
MKLKDDAKKNEKDSLKYATDLRKEFSNDPAVSDTGKIASAFEKIKSVVKGQPSPAGDMSLVFSYMKILDPGSTVREGEFANAQNAANIPDQIRNVYNKAAKGEILNPTQRLDFYNQAKGLYESQRERMKPVEENYRQLSQRYGVDPSLVVKDYGYNQMKTDLGKIVIQNGNKFRVSPDGRAEFVGPAESK